MKGRSSLHPVGPVSVIARRLAALAAYSVVLAGSLLAHQGHDHKILGTVTMAAADHVMVTDRDGKDHTVYLKPATKIVRGKTAVGVGDLLPNLRVVVTARQEGAAGQERMVARTIELGAVGK